MKKQDKYHLEKRKVIVAVSINMHEALKAYAMAKQLRLFDATEKLLKIGLVCELGEKD